MDVAVGVICPRCWVDLKDWHAAPIDMLDRLSKPPGSISTRQARERGFCATSSALHGVAEGEPENAAGEGGEDETVSEVWQGNGAATADVGGCGRTVRFLLYGAGCPAYAPLLGWSGVIHLRRQWVGRKKTHNSSPALPPGVDLGEYGQTLTRN